MKLATLKEGGLDGRLILVSSDGRRAAYADGIAPTLITALRDWAVLAPRLQDLYTRLNQGQIGGAFDFDPAACAAPLPRAPQWLDGSAFLHHGALMEQAFNTPPPPLVDTVPLVYQGASDDFLGPQDDVPLPSEDDGIDFEGEFGVICDAVPMGCTPAGARQRIRLLVQLNDWSLRALGPHEMKTGFGFVQAKPSTAFAPVAVTPDELGAAWQDGRIHMPLHVSWNGQRFGEPNGREMHFDFGQIIAHAAHTRRLTAGTLVGSGTVSNVSRSAGSACISERRVIEKIDFGESRTQYMRFGDRVRMAAHFEDGRPGPFGVIDQRVVAAVPGYRVP